MLNSETLKETQVQWETFGSVSSSRSGSVCHWVSVSFMCSCWPAWAGLHLPLLGCVLGGLQQPQGLVGLFLLNLCKDQKETELREQHAAWTEEWFRAESVHQWWSLHLHTGHIKKQKHHVNTGPLHSHCLGINSNTSLVKTAIGRALFRWASHRGSTWLTLKSLLVVNSIGFTMKAAEQSPQLWLGMDFKTEFTCVVFW